MMSLRTIHQTSRGFTLVEMIVYIAILMLVALGVVAALLSLDDLLAKYRAEQLVFRSSTTVIERVLHDIRKADTVTAADSNNPGTLTLSDDGDSASYSLSSGAVRLAQNGSDVGALTENGVTVSELRFYDYASTTEFVRMQMTLSATVGESTVTRTFNAGATLRGSYVQ